MDNQHEDQEPVGIFRLNVSKKEAWTVETPILDDASGFGKIISMILGPVAPVKVVAVIRNPLGDDPQLITLEPLHLGMVEVILAIAAQAREDALGNDPKQPGEEWDLHPFSRN